MASELLDSPLEGVVFRDVHSAAGRSVEARALDVFWDWDVDINVVGNALLLVVALDLDDKADAGVGRRFHNHIHCEQRLHSDIQTVAHQLEFSIGRDESNKPFVLETAQTHTLMELDVIEFNGLVLGSTSLRFIVSLVIETQLKIRHS